MALKADLTAFQANLKKIEQEEEKKEEEIEARKAAFKAIPPNPVVAAAEAAQEAHEAEMRKNSLRRRLLRRLLRKPLRLEPLLLPRPKPKDMLPLRVMMNSGLLTCHQRSLTPSSKLKLMRLDNNSLRLKLDTPIPTHQTQIPMTNENYLA